MLSNCHCAVRQGQKKHGYGWPAFYIKEDYNVIYYAYQLDHIYNQTLASNSLSMNIWSNFILKNFSGQAGTFMVDEIEICWKQIIDKYLNHEAKIFLLSYASRSF